MKYLYFYRMNGVWILMAMEENERFVRFIDFCVCGWVGVGRRIREFTTLIIYVLISAQSDGALYYNVISFNVVFCGIPYTYTCFN